MKCPYCTGTAFTEGAYDLAQIVRLQPVLIRHVPAHRCNQCCYLQVAAQTMKEVEQLLLDGSPDTLVPAAVYDLASPIRHAAFAFTAPVLMQTKGTVPVPAGANGH